MAIKKKVINSSSSQNNIQNSVSSTTKVSVWTEISKHLMTGISHMIPVLIMGGLLGAISQLIPYTIMGISPEYSIIDAINNLEYEGFKLNLLKLSQLLSSFGFTLFSFAIPLFSAFCANSIGGKIALISGFIGGYIANKPISLLQYIDGSYQEVTPVASGFLGAILIAFIMGYFVKWLNKVIKMPSSYLAFKATFLIPLLSALACMFFMIFIITPVGGFLNNSIKDILVKAGESGEYLYSTLLASAIAFDLGGPINKAAGFVALGLSTDKIFSLTARNIAVVVPSIGLGLATIIDKFIVGKRVYDKQFGEVGKTSIFLAFMGISEGAIPFAIENPAVVIPLNMIGAIIGALIGVGFGAVQWFPESAIWAWPLVENIIPYVLGILVGSLFIAISNILYRNRLIKLGKLQVI